MGLWPFNQNNPTVQDAAFQDLAQMFMSDPQDPTPGSELLDASRLDFSVNSLVVVDRHLEVMRKRPLEGEALMKFVLRCGAYVGEVVRRQSKEKSWHWLYHDDAAKLDKQIASFEKSIATAAVLWDGKDGFCFPLAKVVKYLKNGSEDSVRAFGAVMVGKALEGR